MTIFDCHQFVRFIVVPSKTRPGKTDKFPVNAAGQVCDAHDPANWMTYDQAKACRHGHGFGFVFTDNDPFFFLDIDGALQSDGQWAPIAHELCAALAGCMVEVSQSGTGLHVIGTLAGPVTHGTRNQALGLELYTTRRFVALTEAGMTGSSAHPGNLQPIIDRYFPPGAPGAIPCEWTDGPSTDWSGPTDDSELLQRMLNSRPSAASAFANRATPAELFGADHAALSRCYPDSRPEGFDRSSADAALCAHLAFWTGRDCARMDRLFRMSGLMRDKWDRGAGQGKTYGQLTITKAAANCDRVFSQKPIADTPPDATPADPMTGLREGLQFLSVANQINHFSGCVYIRDAHRIWCPDGGMLKPEQFRAAFGGFSFAMDLVNEKTTRSAWEAFTESSGYHFPKAHGTCFRPEIPAGAIVNEEGTQLVNIYVPITTHAKQGDITPFLTHLHKLLPAAQDRAILLAYMAAVVQYPGVKFQWMPLIQGVEGNGKTLLATCLEHAVGRRYSHRPNANDISNKFNAWLLGKLFIAIEELYVLDRQEAIETLKPLITNERVEIQGKGSNQLTGDNRANFLATTNHKDAIRKTQTDRRYCVFFTDQQEPGDLERAGMAGSYFPHLYTWLRQDGFAIVNHFLRNYPIPEELNPAGLCQRAPITTSTNAAIRAGLGGIEQEVLEAVDEGRPGFAGGWISSIAFDQMLDGRRGAWAVPRAKRRAILQNLGYDWHPGLKEGRVCNPISDVGGLGKPRLFLRYGHLALNLTSPVEIAKAYMDAQAGSTPAGMAFAATGVRNG